MEHTFEKYWEFTRLFSTVVRTVPEEEKPHPLVVRKAIAQYLYHQDRSTGNAKAIYTQRIGHTHANSRILTPFLWPTWNQRQNPWLVASAENKQLQTYADILRCSKDILVALSSWRIPGGETHNLREKKDTKVRDNLKWPSESVREMVLKWMVGPCNL